MYLGRASCLIHTCFIQSSQTHTSGCMVTPPLSPNPCPHPEGDALPPARAEPSLPLSHCTSYSPARDTFPCPPLSSASAELQGSVEMQFLQEIFPTPHLAHLWAPGLPSLPPPPSLYCPVQFSDTSCRLSVRESREGRTWHWEMLQRNSC